MKKAQKKRRAGLSGTLSKGLAAVLAVYLVGTLIYNQVQITAKRQELSDVQEQITQKQQENEELERLIGDGSGNDDAIIERAARDAMPAPVSGFFTTSAGSNRALRLGECLFAGRRSSHTTKRGFVHCSLR